MDRIKQLWQEKPLQLILWVALITRVLAAIFSKGYGWHDDHFLVIESSQSWIDGTDYNNWLPVNGNTTPSGHSFFYPGIHFLLFSFLKAVSITGPQTKMFIVRLLHALFSLITVYCGYKITEKKSGADVAKKVGLLLAVLWFMPFMSVRNLVEFACVPFLAAAIWLLVKHEQDKKIAWFFIAGILLGCALNIRFQLAFFIAGLSLALLITKQWKALFTSGIGAVIAFCGFQSINDYLIWGRPFAEFGEYVRYNIENANNYLTNDWYSYLILIPGLLVPPLSLLWFFGFIRSYRKWLILFLPVLLFVAFHSYFPNKQERFILPAIPFVVIAGVAGWEEFARQSKYWLSHPKLLKGFHVAFRVINIFMLVVFTFTYTKRSRVEAMSYLSAYPVHSLAVECSYTDDCVQLPRFYLNQWIPIYDIDSTAHKPEYFFKQVNELRQQGKPLPDFVLFEEGANMEQRVNYIRNIFPQLKLITVAKPGLVDDVLYRLNKHNRNKALYIYSTQ